jgi:hypothetical protein
MGIHTSKLICYAYVTTDDYSTLANTSENDIISGGLTPHRTGELAVELDLNALIAVPEGGTVTCRLKHKIDETTLRTIDICEFIVGTDEIHPTLTGWVDHQVATSVQVSIQCSIAPTAGRVIPYKIIEAS